MKLGCEILNTLSLSAENLIEIGSVVSEIWPGKLKSRDGVYSGRCIYLAKYRISDMKKLAQMYSTYLMSLSPTEASGIFHVYLS